jgi:hypothetical protein
MKTRRSSLPRKYESLSVKFGKKKIEEDFTTLLRLEGLAPGQIIRKMDEAPAIFFYWSNLKSNVDRTLTKAQDDYEYWYASKMLETTGKTLKDREYRLIVENRKEWRNWKKRLRKLKLLKKKVDVAEKSIEKHITLLQSIGAMKRFDIEGHNMDEKNLKDKTKLKKGGKL